MAGRRTLLALLFLVAASATTLPAASIPNDTAAVTHALNRLTFGVRPGDVERVQKEGLSKWIDAQLRDPLYPDPPGSPIPDPGSRLDPKEMRQQARRAVNGLAAAKLERAVTADRQLEEILVDFWFNHFNVNAAKGRTALYVASYERDAIRPHIFGSFRELLGATAHHPAMLFYLDNASSGRKGVNENYARELMELHTLGVDGGYTQHDVTEVARAFTGWTIDRTDATFRFARGMHEAGTKTVLGHTIRENGEQEGEQVLDILAEHPATAHFIATRLAQRFVSDNPPASLVDRAAKRFHDTHGNLREVVRTIITSPEFFAPEARNAKVKTPLEFVASALRSTADPAGSRIPDPGSRTRIALRGLRELGMPLYLCQPPTGYDNTAEPWIAAGALVARMNLAHQIPGVDADLVGSPAFQKK